MKLAVAGKGGVGKTTIAGTLARLLARMGPDVLALDCDPSPNLGIPLGLSHAQLLSIRPVFNTLVESGHTHNDPKPDPEELLRRCQTTAADGVTLLATGEVVRRGDACMCCGSHASTRALFSDLSGDGRIIVADLEAGLNDLLWARPGGGDMLLCVAEPSVKSIDIAARACRIGQALGVSLVFGIANRCTEPEDHARVSAVLGVPVYALPEDPALAEADRLGVAPLDHDPDSPAMVAMREVASQVAHTIRGVATPA
ncbi:MAG: AAA family ATPase [Candidatus Dormibacteraeota bacterium]|nr:AAA family ATPase [Candidatus Dormibacteraeota bacterium]